MCEFTHIEPVSLTFRTSYSKQMLFDITRIRSMSPALNSSFYTYFVYLKIILT